MGKTFVVFNGLQLATSRVYWKFRNSKSTPQSNNLTKYMSGRSQAELHKLDMSG
jgi:hypothetical protein